MFFNRAFLKSCFQRREISFFWPEYISSCNYVLMEPKKYPPTRLVYVLVLDGHVEVRPVPQRVCVKAHHPLSLEDLRPQPLQPGVVGVEGDVLAPKVATLELAEYLDRITVLWKRESSMFFASNHACKDKKTWTAKKSVVKKSQDFRNCSP